MTLALKRDVKIISLFDPNVMQLVEGTITDIKTGYQGFQTNESLFPMLVTVQ